MLRLILVNILQLRSTYHNRKRLGMRKIGTRSVHVGSLCEVSQDNPNYNCTSLRIMTMSNTHDRNFAVYGQTQANCNVFFL